MIIRVCIEGNLEITTTVSYSSSSSTTSYSNFESSSKTGFEVGIRIKLVSWYWTLTINGIEKKEGKVFMDSIV